MTTQITKTNLELLNAFRVADGKTEFKDWRKARHEQMLADYMAAAEAECPPTTEDAKVVVLDSLTKVAEFANEQLDGKAKAIDDEIADAGKPAKLPSYKQMAHISTSSVDKPVGFVHQFLSQHPDLTRKQAVAALVEYGVAYATARTQYQRWFSKKNKG